MITEYLGPRTFHRNLVVRERKKVHRSRTLAAALVLTPLVDCFSMLVIFLLQTFSASPQMAVVTKGVELPMAATGKEMVDAPVLAISPEEVFVDQKPVGKTQELLKNPTPLMVKLKELRERWMKTYPNQTFKGEITLQAHQKIESSTISRFMAMLPSQNYGLIQLAVLSGSPVPQSDSTSEEGSE